MEGRFRFIYVLLYFLPTNMNYCFQEVFPHQCPKGKPPSGVKQKLIDAGEFEGTAGSFRKIRNGHRYAFVLRNFLESNEESEAGAVDEVKLGGVD